MPDDWQPSYEAWEDRYTEGLLERHLDDEDDDERDEPMIDTLASKNIIAAQMLATEKLATNGPLYANGSPCVTPLPGEWTPAYDPEDGWYVRERNDKSKKHERVCVYEAKDQADAHAVAAEHNRPIFTAYARQLVASLTETFALSEAATPDLLGIIRDLRDALHHTRVMVACYEIGKRPGDTILDGYQKGPDAITRAGEVLKGAGQ